MICRVSIVETLSEQINAEGASTFMQYEKKE